MNYIILTHSSILNFWSRVLPDYNVRIVAKIRQWDSQAEMGNEMQKCIPTGARNVTIMYF